MTTLREAAEGRWRDILPALGVDSRWLRNAHGACPFCQAGKDRFRFDDKGHGMFYCNACGAGDGVTFLMKYKNIDFKECVKMVESILPNTSTTPVRPRPQTDIKAAWNRCKPVVPGDPVDVYLAARGLTARPASLRFSERCHNSKREVYPAMVAWVSGPDGSATAHRTYLAGEQKTDLKAPRELVAGKVPEGGAVRLAHAAEHMGVAEGIETALSAMQMFGVPVWAALNAGMLEKWTPPAECKRVTIFGDRDESFTGEKSAYALAFRLKASGYEVEVKLPLCPGQDWNDVLMDRP